MRTNRQTLILGLPRSGTSWVCDTLSRAGGSETIFEPDNEKTSLLAVALKQHQPRFPTLHPSQLDERLTLLWRYAFRGRFARLLTRSFCTRWLKLHSEQQERGVRRKESALATGRASEGRSHRFLDSLLRRTLLRHSPRRKRLVKSVHACFCAEWVVRQTAVDDVLIVLRSPYAVIASLKRMGMPDGWREGSMRPYLSGEQWRDLTSSATSGQSAIRRIAVQVCRQHQALLSAREGNPQWHVTTHEHLCEDPPGNFRTLFDQLGLDWRAGIERHIASRNRPGRGYQTLRMAKQQADKWKEELTAEEVAMIDSELQAQGLAEWTDGELAAR